MDFEKDDRLVAMYLVKNGADVYSVVIAGALRSVQRDNPEYIEILSIKELEYIHNKKFDGAGQLPYFGAILTDEGKEYLKQCLTELKNKGLTIHDIGNNVKTTH